MAAVAMPLLQLSLGTSPAMAFTPPPAGFRLQVDKLDGYAFIYPETWLQVSGGVGEWEVLNSLHLTQGSDFSRAMQLAWHGCQQGC